MKKFTLFFTMLMVIALMVPVSYAAKDVKGAASQATENASDEAVFNRVGDWFATVGKSDQEKAQIKAERRAKRIKQKAERKAKKEAEKLEKGLRNTGGDATKLKKKAMKNEKQMDRQMKNYKKEGSANQGSMKKGS